MGEVVNRLVSRLVGGWLLKPIGALFLHATQFVLGLTQREVVNLGQPSRARAAARIREIVTGFPEQTVGVDEAYLLLSAVHATQDVPGVLAEVGVFRGGTARVICEAKGDRPLHLFDTFEGLPEPGIFDTWFKKGQYACDLNTVKAYLANYEQVYFYPGLFLATAEAIHGLRFSFVHLDVDLYESTLSALEFFYPRMSRAAMLISHDYVEFPGVRKAFDEYFEGRRQPVLELTGNQCLVVKVTD